MYEVAPRNGRPLDGNHPIPMLSNIYSNLL